MLRLFRSVLFLVLALAGFSNQAFAQIVNIEARRGNLSDTTGLFGKLGAGLNIVDNGSTVLTVHGNAQLEWLRPKTDYLLLLNYNLVRAGDNSFVNDGFMHVRYNRALSDIFTWEAYGQIQYNERLRILFRGLLGTGPRLQLLHGENSVAYFGLSYMYEYEEISDTSIIHRDQRMSSYVSFQINPVKSLMLSGTTYFQPLLNDFSTFRLSSKTALQVAINQRLSLVVSFSITFDARLKEEVPDLPSRIYSIQNTLTYKF
ncbi:MAG: DUF481 domain-containing protein [Saprospiraceae bacterium]|nr:DUF481 domain-containing protein [Saprospiraceae bacterium]